MIIESPIGRYFVTADNALPDIVIVTADKKSTLASIMDGVELMAGASGEDQSFSLSDIRETNLFGRTRFEITLSRTQLTRYFQYEILNFLDYTSLAQMKGLK